MHAARLLRPFGLVWLEEPVAPDDFPAHRRVRDVGIPIAAGENLHTLAEFQALLAAGGARLPGARPRDLRRHHGLAQGGGRWPRRTACR